MLSKSLTFLALIASMNAHSMVTRQYDQARDCELYSIVSKERNNNGDYVLERKIEAHETIIDDRTHYGLESKNLSIDFERRSASFEIISQVAFGFNKNLLDRDGARVSISADNAQFDQAINQVNRKLFSFSEVCLGQNNEVVYLQK